MEAHTWKVIARIQSDFREKFGIPRQSGLVKGLTAKVVFEPEFRSPDALRGLEGFSHLWLIWEFSKAVREDWSPMVRPPRLGGNVRLGVFATRSPFRPNPIGLSCVRLEELREEAGLGTVLIVSGADLLDGTPIYDIKPYLPYTDCRPEAVGGFAADAPAQKLQVSVPEPLLQIIPEAKRNALIELLSLDPRPSYHRDPERNYGMCFGEQEIHFFVQGSLLTVTDIRPHRQDAKNISSQD